MICRKCLGRTSKTKLVSPVDPVVNVSSIREIASKKRRHLKDYFKKFKANQILKKCCTTWKLKKRRAGSFLSPYCPASSLSSIRTSEMSSSAQSSAIVSRFFTIWRSLKWKSCLKETSSYLLVPLGAEKEHGNVVELADKPPEDNISHLKLKWGERRKIIWIFAGWMVELFGC